MNKFPIEKSVSSMKTLLTEREIFSTSDKANRLSSRIKKDIECVSDDISSNNKWLSVYGRIRNWVIPDCSFQTFPSSYENTNHRGNSIFVEAKEVLSMGERKMKLSALLLQQTLKKCYFKISHNTSNDAWILDNSLRYVIEKKRFVY